MIMDPGSFTLMPVPSTNWIPREVHGSIAEFLLHYKLCKLDNTRQLPLANGGMTDIYIDMRHGRSAPAANEALASLFAPPLRWLGVDRFLEVPDAVSGIAALLSAQTGIPYATIRKQPKEGRASDARIIGEVRAGENVAIIDDVITDGQSKVPALRLCKERDLNVRAIIVLVDRQQGWEANLQRHGLYIPVWAGMTLHDLRRQMVRAGKMEQCDPAIEEKNPLIVALDGMSLSDTLAVADRLRPMGCILKVNDLCFAEGFNHVLPELQTYGRVMVDLKSHDIGNTVRNTMEKVGMLEPWAVTIHASGGRDMIATARAVLPKAVKLLAVTVLTSLDDAECREVYHCTAREQVETLAELAVSGGADGLVCSAQEVPYLRSKYPDILLVVPGARSPSEDTHDQLRVDTPEQIMAADADHIVMGRQILNAPDPAAEVDRIMREELRIV